MDVVTLALSKKYTEDTAIGLGAVRGAPCSITNIVRITGGSRITFSWKGTDGTVQTRDMDVYDGVSVVSVTVDPTNNHLIVTLSDGNSVDCGELPVVDNAEDVDYDNASQPTLTNVAEALNLLIQNMIDNAEDVSYSNPSYPTLTNVKLALNTALENASTLDQSLKVTNEVGSATSGKVYAAGTSLETILRDILIKEVAPGLTLSIVPNTILYDKVTQTVSSLTVKAAVTVSTYPLSKVEFYLGNTLQETVNISTAGTYQHNQVWGTPTNTDFVVKAIVYDTKAGTPMTTTKSITVKFVGKSYYGIVDASIGEPTEGIIKALQNNTLKDVKGFVYNNIVMDYGKVVYAYPKSFGDLSSIKDIPNNISYWPDSFTKTVVTVDGIEYNCYTQNEASAAESIQLTFA